MNSLKYSEKSFRSASEILKIFRDDYTAARRPDAIVSINEDGDLLYYAASCGIDDGETVLIDGLESDSMGDGWEDATPADVLSWIESHYLA